jgi:hypothetical protein
VYDGVISVIAEVSQQCVRVLCRQVNTVERFIRT